MLQIKHIAFLVVFVLGALTAQAQVTFTAKVSKTKLGINERLRVDFEMNADGDNFNPPAFEDFRVVGGPNQAISNSYINGKRSYSKTYSYFIAPLRKGTLKIGQAEIIVDGQTYKTIPTSVEVLDAVKTPTEGNNAEFVAEDNVHLVAEVSNSNPYLNERITVTYKLYVSKDVSITSRWREIATPRYADFWSKNIDATGQFKTLEGKYKGEDYRYVILRTTVLYPQKTGNLDIEPLTLDIPIDVPSTKRTIFGGRLSTRINKTISAGSRTINVKPLPFEGKPDNFGGAVGEFQFNVTASKTTLDANESLELTTTVTGNGNLMTLTLPSVKTPSTLEMYEPERTENIRTRASGISGSISEKYAIVPQYKGQYPIRPIEFSYFNPKTETYESITSQELVINVENGPITEAADPTVDENGNIGKAVVLSQDDFKYLKLDSDLSAMETTPFFKSTTFWSLVGGPLLLIPLFILVGKKRDSRRADVQGTKLRKANKMARKYLAAAKKQMGNQTLFYESLERSLHNYLKASLQIETSEMSKEHIEQLLVNKGVENATVSNFVSLLKSCEFARYTPSSNVTIQQDYDKAVSTISTIDKQLK